MIPEIRDQKLILKPEGELNKTGIQNLMPVIKEALDSSNQVETVICDLQSVSDFAAEAVNFLAGLHSECRKKGYFLKIEGASAKICEYLQYLRFQ